MKVRIRKRELYWCLLVSTWEPAQKKKTPILVFWTIYTQCFGALEPRIAKAVALKHPTLWKLVKFKIVQPFASQLMFHILVQGSIPCRGEMAFLLGLRCEFLLLHFVLTLQCIDLARCLVQDLILKMMKN